MTFGLLNLAMLFGLIAVAIPPLIHLLNRRRFEVVDWGAMQFLQLSHARRRRLLFEDLLLMLLRMGLIAVLVLALAAPYAAGPLIALLGERPPREVVLIVDGSYSMGRDDGTNPTPHERAKDWAGKLLRELSAEDRVTILQTGRSAAVLGTALSPSAAREALDQLPQPLGTGDGPRAVIKALELLQSRGKNKEQDVILLTDGQRFGWADPASLGLWQQAAAQLRAAAGEEETAASQPRLWFVNLQAHAEVDPAPPNFALAPLRGPTTQVWAGHSMSLQTTLSARGQSSSAWPVRLRLEVDGKFVRYLPLPATADRKTGQVPLPFTHVVRQPGSHLLSVVLEPDSSRNQPPAGSLWADVLPADNRCDLAVLVQPTLPVLLVDGDEKLSAQSSTFFLRRALTDKPVAQAPPRVLARAVPVAKFAPNLLTRDLQPNQAGSRPRVLILADVPRLSQAQQAAVEKFLAQGGSVLVLLGRRIGEPTFYNEQLFRGGQGWLPARLEKVTVRADTPEQEASLEIREAQHPVLSAFHKQAGAFRTVRFPQWWRVRLAPSGNATTVALLTTGDPMLVERTYLAGKVVLCTVPPDGAWDSTLPRSWENPVLIHQLVYYLASLEAVPYNVAAGQPLHYAPDPRSARAADVHSVAVRRPEGNTEVLPVNGWPFQYEDTHVPGVYRIQPKGELPVYYVVAPDRRESDLTPLTEQDRKDMARHVALRYEDNPQTIAQVVIDPTHQEDLWWALLLLVVLLLCLEIWLTRRLARQRGG